MRSDSDLQTEIIDHLTSEMSKEIDNHVMCELLEESGWHLVRLNRSLREYDPEFKEICEWVKQHAQGKYHGYSDTWAFSDSRDSMLFALKWC